MGKTLRPYQNSAIFNVHEKFKQLYTRLCLVGPTGSGKCHSPETEVLMVSGETKMVKDLKIGEQLMGPDSQPRNILSLCQGREEMFEVMPTKGGSWKCNISHILSLINTDTNKVLNISVKDYLKQSETFKHRHKLYRTGVEFESTPTSFDPYLIGRYLGGNNECVPKMYKINRKEVRLQVLAGLLDSEGYLQDGCFKIVTKCKRLKEDILFLARSLGLAAYSFTEDVYYKINISGNVDEIPTKIESKQAKPKKQKKNFLRTSFKLKSIGEGNYRGFTLDGDHLYLLKDFTVTHNTFIFCYIAALCFKNNTKVLIVVDSEQILRQTCKTLKEEFGIVAIRVSNGRKPSMKGNFYVAMAQTLKRRSKKLEYLEWFGTFPMVIFDECHNQHGDFLHEHLAQDAYVIGCTATPVRTGNQRKLNTLYQDLTLVSQVYPLIQLGNLVNARHYCIKGANLSDLKTSKGEYSHKSVDAVFGKKILHVGVYENYMRICPGTKFMVFCVSISNARELHQELVTKGLIVGIIDSKNTPNAERDKTLLDLKEGRIMGIVNVGILTTGYDEPSIQTIILYRATKSLALYIQMIGRGSRPCKEVNKTHFNILDFGGNSVAFGPFWQDRNWSLEEKNKKEKDQNIVPMKSCPRCEELLHTSVSVCPCGYIFPKTEVTKEEVILQEMSFEQVNALPVSNTVQIELVEKARVTKEYRNGWVLNKFTTRVQFQEYAKLRNYSRGWVEKNIKLYGIE